MSRNLILPEPKNLGAKIVVEKSDVIVSQLPSSLEHRAFLAACISEVNDSCGECSPRSVAVAVMNCAMLGLMPGKARGLVYFIPFKQECTLVPGYRGFLELAFANQFLKCVHTEVVLRDELFDQWVDGGGPQVRHQVPIDRTLTKDNVMAAYCVYQTIGGGHGVEVVSRKELDKIPQRNVWKSNYIEMARKTAVRRAAKLWRTNKQLDLAVQLDELAERDEHQPNYSGVPEIEDPGKLSLKDLPESK